MNNGKMKIVAVIPSGFCFGLQHISIDLFANSKKWIDPHFLITRWNNGDFEKLVRHHELDYSFSWLGMFSRKLDWHNMKMSLHALSKVPRLYYDFLTLIRKKKPAILFFANHHELLLLLPILWLVKTKVVCHMHDPSPAIPFQLKSFAWYGKRVNLFIAISEDVKKRLMKLGCPEKKIVVVHNGVSMPKIEHEGRSNRFVKQFDWPKDSFIIGITGQMTSTKGHEDLVEAFSKAVQKNEKLKLVIGGKKLEPLYGRLKYLIEENGLGKSVMFSDWLADAADFYQAIDLFVLASRHDEGYGLVVAEAMSHGRPVITTQSGGAVEIVEDGINGYIVQKQNAEEIAKKITILSEDSARYQDFSKKAIRRIEKHFTMEVATARFYTVLKTVM
jgi:glycosyltransferase involved in cell wall biosynthesis